ncbi:MAG: hypothetical protein D4R65_10155 [Verrucomicrobiaceae bacterium]|nr:MAG: hypothetical protein D4R65_10155 [Verrucomicrobiaceae bacterium]
MISKSDSPDSPSLFRRSTTYAALKMNADDIISQIQALPAEEDGREWALELETAEGKQVRFCETVSPLWEILGNIMALEGGEMQFRYAGILRLPTGSSYSRTFDGQQLLPFGDLARIKEALEVEMQNQQSKGGLSEQERQAKLKIF